MVIREMELVMPRTNGNQNNTETKTTANPPAAKFVKSKNNPPPLKLSDSASKTMGVGCGDASCDGINK
jgi:hypothetical protein